VSQLHLAWGESKQVQRLDRSAEVFQEIMNTPDKGIPLELLDRAACIGIIPSVKKFAFGFGGRHGAGYVVCRANQGGGAWGPLSGFSISGGSFGLQLGFSATDYVLLFMNSVGMEKLLQDRFTLGGDASVAAGPVGRTAAAATDAQLHAKILGYSRSKGLFAGLALEGAVLRPSPDDNEELYGREVSAKELLVEGTVLPPAEAAPLLRALAGVGSSTVVAQSTAVSQPEAAPKAEATPDRPPKRLANAAIAGHVRDVLGAVIPDATITILNVESGNSKTVGTDATGRYLASGLPPGTYHVRAAAVGLGQASQQQVTLTAGTTVALDLTIVASH
jgi:lipid-binding SYLF domain-containing protein